MDLDLWGHRVRVRAGVPEAASVLRDALADHVLPDAVPLGFALKPPDSPKGLHSLVDRSGLVLARARSWQECVAVLAEHLATFAPPPAGTIRTTMRAVIRGDGAERTAVLAAFPLLSLPPLVERQLAQRDQRVVDRLAIYMDPNGALALSALPWTALRAQDPIGHCGAGANGTPVTAILVPTGPGASIRRHQIVALISSTFTDVTAETALNMAEQFVDVARAVPMSDVAARRRALET